MQIYVSGLRGFSGTCEANKNILLVMNLAAIFETWALQTPYPNERCIHNSKQKKTEEVWQYRFVYYWISLKFTRLECHINFQTTERETRKLKMTPELGNCYLKADSHICTGRETYVYKYELSTKVCQLPSTDGTHFTEKTVLSSLYFCKHY